MQEGGKPDNRLRSLSELRVPSKKLSMGDRYVPPQGSSSLQHPTFGIQTSITWLVGTHILSSCYREPFQKSPCPLNIYSPFPARLYDPCHFLRVAELPWGEACSLAEKKFSFGSTSAREQADANSPRCPKASFNHSVAHTHTLLIKAAPELLLGVTFPIGEVFNTSH